MTLQQIITIFNLIFGTLCMWMGGYLEGTQIILALVGGINHGFVIQKILKL